MNNETLFATYTTQAEADVAVRTYNLYVTDGTGRVARSNRVSPGVYQVFLVAPVEYELVMVRKAA